MPALRKRNLAKIVHAGMNSFTGHFCSGFRRQASGFSFGPLSFEKPQIAWIFADKPVTLADDLYPFSHPTRRPDSQGILVDPWKSVGSARVAKRGSPKALTSEV